MHGKRTTVRLRGFDHAGIARAIERGKLSARTAAVAVVFNAAADAVRISLRNGTVVAVPREIIDGLRGLPKQVARRLVVGHHGEALTIEPLDIHISVRGVIRKAVMGDDPYALAGRSRSPAKVAAARKNGTRGGRPRKAA